MKRPAKGNRGLWGRIRQALHRFWTPEQHPRIGQIDWQRPGGPTNPVDEPLLCPGCGEFVLQEVAYRDGPLPFHWNAEGGGHTMDPAAWH